MRYLRPSQVSDIENEKQVILRTLEGRDVQDRGNLTAHIGRIDRQLELQAPPDLTGEQRDQAVRENREIEARLIPLMPSDAEMRRNPPGVVGRHKKYDKASKSKKYFKEGDIFRWKDNRLALHKGDDDPDVANFELMRPLDNMGSMEGAQIPGQRYHGTNPSEAFKAGFDRTFGTNGKEVTSVEASTEAAETIVDLPAKVTRKKVTRKKSAAKKNGAAKKSAANLTELACGRMMGTAGRHFHIKKCEVCTEAATKE